MKCLIINGSPSKSYSWDGNVTTSFTAKLADEVKSAMSANGDVEFEEIRLIDANLPYCRGCYNCFYKGEDKCPHRALVQPIAEKIKEADCLILTSPVYALHVSGLIKNLFDLTAYNFHRPRFFNKKALVISSTAGGAAKTVCKYMRDTLEHWGFNRVYTLPIIRMGAVDLTDKMKLKCQMSAKKLYAGTSSGIPHSPSFKYVFYYQLWRSMSLKTPGADRDYWQESGLVNHEYAPNVRIGSVKRVFGKTMFGMFKRVMK